MKNKNLKFENKDHTDRYFSQNLVGNDVSFPLTVLSLVISAIVAIGIALLPLLLN